MANKKPIPKGREKSLSIAAVNIRIHPHTTEKYIELFETAFDLKRPIGVRGEEHLVMLSLYALKDNKNKKEGIRGEFARYTKIDTDGRWLNTQKLKAAEDADKRRISIPKDLQPNLKEFRFVFFPENHHLFFEINVENRKISAVIVERYLKKIFSSREISAKFNKVELTVIPQSETLEQIWKISKLTNLDLMVRRPNPDFFDAEERAVYERMDAQNMAEVNYEYKAVPGCSIEPDATTKTLAKIAAHNGLVTAVGRDAKGKKVIESTKNHPMIETGSYFQNQINAADYFISLVDVLKAKIFKKK